MDYTSLYPISQVIAKIIGNSGYTPYGFLLAIRDTNAEASLADLESWLEKGQGDESTIARIAAAEPEAAEQLREAVAATAAMIAAGVDPVAFDRETREHEAESRFTPYIHIQGEATRPSQITIFGLTGGHEKWSTIRIPRNILRMPLEKQLEELPKLMAQHNRENEGLSHYFGRITGFMFVRFRDYFEFNAVGELLWRVEGPFWRAEVSVELKGRPIPTSWFS